MDEIGQRIRELRNKYGYSLRDLGDKINVTYSHLSRVENGKVPASIEVLTKLCELFNVEITYFFSGEFGEEEKEFLQDVKQEKQLDELIKELKGKYQIKLGSKELNDENLEAALKLMKKLME